MDNQKQILGIKCPDKDCAHTFKMYAPDKAGIYKVECPRCKKQFKMNMPDAKKESFPVDCSGETAKRLSGEYLANESHIVLCPHCGKAKMRFTPKNAGEESILCPKCKGKSIVFIKKKTEPISVSEVVQVRGKLQLLRKGWFNRDFALPIGKHVIGRCDKDFPSDISIKDDVTMSRRSVVIEVCQGAKGYSFKMTVLKATNPVLHNNRPLGEGECVSLNYGDCIILGNTKFRFVKA